MAHVYFKRPPLEKQLTSPSNQLQVEQRMVAFHNKQIIYSVNGKLKLIINKRLTQDNHVLYRTKKVLFKTHFSGLKITNNLAKNGTFSYIVSAHG